MLVVVDLFHAFWVLRGLIRTTLEKCEFVEAINPRRCREDLAVRKMDLKNN